MKIRIPASELKYALAGLGKVIPRKPKLPVLGHILVEASPGQVHLSATDLEAFVTYTCRSAEVIRPGKALVDYQRLKDLAGNNQDEVTLEATKANELTITLDGPLGTRQQVLPAINATDWPSTPDPVSTKPADPEFLPRFKSLMPFCSTDVTRAVLCGVYHEVSSSKHALVATDGRRLTSYNSLDLPLPDPCIIPAHKFLTWPKLEGEVSIGLSKDKNQFRLECGPWTIQLKTIEGTFPNWKQVVPDLSAGTGVNLVDEDIPVLNDAAKTLPISEPDTRAMVIIGNHRKLQVAANDPDTDKWVFRDLPHSRAEGEVAIAINRKMFQEAVKAGFRNFNYQDENSPLSATDGNGGIHVLMPVRAPLPETRQPRKGKQTIKQEKPMPRKTNGNSPGTQADDQLWLSYQQVKEKARELNTAISDLGTQIKESRRQDKVLKSELNSARGLLNKLQSIKI